MALFWLCNSNKPDLVLFFLCDPSFDRATDGFVLAMQ